MHAEGEAGSSKDKKLRRKRLDGAGGKPNDVEMEEVPSRWIVDLHCRHLRVSCRMIRMQAMVLSTDRVLRLVRACLTMKRHSLSLSFQQKMV